MKTIGEHIIENFQKLDKPMERGGMLKPFIYQGTIKNLPLFDNVEDIIVYWDEDGKCANMGRRDCFIDINDSK